MKIILFTLLLSVSVQAKPKFWVSNRIEAGYDKLYIGESITFQEGVFTKSALAFGLRFKISHEAKYKAFYLLENTKENKWQNSHFLGASLNFKFR